MVNIDNQSQILVENIVVRFRANKKQTSKNKTVKDILAIDHITLTIFEGEKVGLVGRNGSGKSTLLKVLSGVLMPNRGSVQINGQMLAILNQRSGLIPEASLKENIRLKAYSLLVPSKNIDNFITEVFARTGFQDRADMPLKSLSAGMTGKFNIALNSQVIRDITVLDEWISALEVPTESGKTLLDWLVEQAKIVILASHNNRLIRKLCNRIVVLEQGQILYDGNNFDFAFQLMDRVKELTSKKDLSVQLIKRQLDVELQETLKFKNQCNESISANTEEKPCVFSPSTNYATVQTKVYPPTLIHFIHVPKTGGYVIKSVLENSQNEKFHFIFHGINTSLDDIPKSELIMFYVSNPFERFCKAFDARQNRGAPFYNAEHSYAERNAFKRYSNCNQLAEDLSSSDHKSIRAAKAMSAIQHLGTSIISQLGGLEALIERKNDIVFVGQADNFKESLNKMFEKFSIKDSEYELIEQRYIDYLCQNRSNALSVKAKNNLAEFYSDDLDFLAKLKVLVKLHV